VRCSARAGLARRCPSPRPRWIGAIVTGRVVSALPRLALTSLIGSGRHHTAADVNIGTIPLAADRAPASAPAIGLLITDFRVEATLSQLSFIVVMFARGRWSAAQHARRASRLSPCAAADVRGGRLAAHPRRHAGRPAGAGRWRPRRVRPGGRLSRSSAACAEAPHDPAHRRSHRARRSAVAPPGVGRRCSSGHFWPSRQP
jgi:hypothetical protein